MLPLKARAGFTAFRIISKETDDGESVTIEFEIFRKKTCEISGGEKKKAIKLKRKQKYGLNDLTSVTGARLPNRCNAPHTRMLRRSM